MASATVRDVLKQIEGFHWRLAEMYGALQRCATNERVRMLARYLAEREGRLVTALENYQEDVRNTRTLDYWFKVPPVMPEELGLHGVELDPEISTDDLSNFGVRLDAALGTFVQRISEAATSLRVRELFADLMAQEEREKRQTARATLEVEREM
jgi:hypothetical protein